MSRPSSLSALAALAIFSLPACSATAPPSSLGNPGDGGADHRLTVMPPGAIALGSLPPGQAADASLTLKNASSEAVTVDRVETSCPCIRVTPLPTRVEGGSGRSLTVAFDPREEPEFRGRLAVDLTGYDLAGAVLFRSRVDLEVQGTALPSHPRMRPATGGVER